uniref:Reverse transcriptase domain-containing protein n=1 Tax=Arundo donax TaxID=35708 RepID=A0A0A8ZXJ2_ARUDO
MAERRMQGLYFNCPEKFSKKHLKTCTMKGIYLLELADDAAVDEGYTDDGVQVSLYALTGVKTGRTMHLAATMGATVLRALVDSGSTYSFLATDTAARLGLPIAARPGLHVGVANGEWVLCIGICEHARVRIGAEDFDIDFYIIPLNGYEMVLGCQWLRTLGPILWDFDRLSMAFWREDNRVKWFGLEADAAPRVDAIGNRDVLELLLVEYVDIFEPPQGLPPPRQFDHHIHLLPRTAPVAMRPYRYPQLLKDEIEKQCDEMLRQGIIRTSTSTFSSLVLLVRKHDKSWRFCVDYRTLNAKTVKDKFPIPVVDEILDELKGARFFTKLDLQSGYHQVLMNPPDIEKTAFHTHHDHFEFLVMSFDLTNAPAMFQALMNDVLKPFIHHFVLVFFDDVLIYSASWVEHLQHVRAVFQVMRENKFALKLSKCLFGEMSMAYLGHIISGQDVAMDLEKIKAVVAWPTPSSVRALRGFPRLDQVLPQVHPGLWCGGGALDQAPQARGVLVVTRSGGGVSSTQGGAHIRSSTVAP